MTLPVRVDAIVERLSNTDRSEPFADGVFHADLGADPAFGPLLAQTPGVLLGPTNPAWRGLSWRARSGALLWVDDAGAGNGQPRSCTLAEAVVLVGEGASEKVSVLAPDIDFWLLTADETGEMADLLAGAGRDWPAVQLRGAAAMLRALDVPDRTGRLVLRAWGRRPPFVSSAAPPGSRAYTDPWGLRTR